MAEVLKPTLRDFDDVFELLKQLFFYEKLSKKKTEQIFKRDLRSKESMQFVLRIDKKIVGYAAISFREDIQSQGRIGYLSDLIIDKDFRGKGYGTLLLKQVMKRAKSDKCREIHFPSTFKRKKAHKYYESLGFHKTAYFFWKEL